MLVEDRRNDLIAQGRRGEKEKGDGKSRYEKRVKSRLSTSVREYNSIDMNSVFLDGILTVNIPVKGETANYLVRIKFGGFLDLLQQEANRIGKVDLRTITRALITAFNSDDVYISCSCPDWRYRMQYWATVKDINSGAPESRAANITNPHNNKGPGCKHVMLVLSNTSWILKTASVLNNYIKYMQQNREADYAKYIYPALYGKEYEEPVQLSFDDSKTGELDTSTDTIDTANELGRVSGRFRTGNPYRFQKKDNKPVRGQMSFDDLEVEDDYDKEEEQ